MKTFTLPPAVHLDLSQRRTQVIAVLGGVGAIVLLALLLGSSPAQGADDKAVAPAAAASGGKPALTVTTVAPRTLAWAVTLPANGNIAPWQEALVGAEAGGLRITDVKVNVGDTVKRGQVLAVLSAATVEADLAATRAALAEAEASQAEAQANAERARQLQSSGAISAQQINQYLTAERTAAARVQAQRARLKAEQVRLSQTRITAPDSGVISARSATVGAVVQPGQELFRLIRGGRLEWRAEVTAAELSRVKAGQKVTLQAADGSAVNGTVRMVAPTVDPATRNGLVYVDLLAGSAARAGMFARGTVQIGDTQALTLPQAAVALRDGYSYAFRVGADGRVAQTKLGLGRRVGDRVEVLQGLKVEDKVVAGGVGFLSDGDLVRVVDGTAANAAKPAAPTVAKAAAGTPKQ